MVSTQRVFMDTGVKQPRYPHLFQFCCITETTIHSFCVQIYCW